MGSSLTRSIVALATLPLTASALAPVARTASQTDPLFHRELFDAGAHPARLAAGDLDGDGLPDLVAVGTEVVAILRSTGDGRFEPGPSVPLASPATDVALADLDGDGALDALVALPATNRVLALTGDGAGEFGNAVSWSAGATPRAVALGDVDGDGVLDAAVANGFAHTASVLLGDGSGGFGTPSPVPSPFLAYDLELADANLDGQLDLVVLNRGNATLSVHAGDGLGGFAAPLSATVTSLPHSFVLEDFDGDGWLDAAVGGEGTLGPWALLGGPAGFAPIPGVGVPAATSVTLGDVDDDGHADLYFAGLPADEGGTATDAFVYVLRSQGTGSFDAPQAFHAGTDAREVLALDADGDGLTDLVSLHPVLGAVCVHASTESGGAPLYAGPTSFESLPADVYGHVFEARALDADGDGNPDLALFLGTLSTPGANRVGIALGDGQGGFAQPVAPLPFPLWLGGLDTGDLDGDGDEDLVATRYLAPNTPALMQRYASAGDGSLVQLPSVPLFPGDPEDIVLHDLDLDGDLDAAVPHHRYVGGLTWTGSLGVWFNDGAGGFGAGSELAVGRYRCVAAGDVTSDGAPDLVAGRHGASDLDRFVNTGGGTFAAPVATALGFEPTAVTVVDLDADGARDALGVGWNSGDAVGRVGWLRGDGLGGFRTVVPGVTGRGPTDLAAADLDGDGALEVLTANSYEGTFSVLALDAGVAGFAEQRRFLNRFGCATLLPLDADLDGRPELVAPQANWQTVWVYDNLEPAPPGCLAYGSGTPGHEGGHGLTADRAPAVGESAFELLSSNAPPEGAGLLVLGLGADYAGSDPLGVGLVLHLDVFAPLPLIAPLFSADELGQGRAALPLPADAALAGKTVFAQALWFWPGPPAPSLLTLSSSRGLRITIQP